MNLFGFKTLSVLDGTRVTSLFYHDSWNSGKLRAVCRAYHFVPLEYNRFIDEVPEDTCRCGIWGSSPAELVALEYCRSNRFFFMCLIQAIGKTLLMRNDQEPERVGFRTAEAKIIAVIKPDKRIEPTFKTKEQESPNHVWKHTDIVTQYHRTYERAQNLLDVPFIDLDAAKAMTEASWEWWQQNG